MARGSKPGERRGGRTKGTPNKKTAETVAKIEAAGITPLEFMLSVLRDEEQPFDERKWAAQSAAPFVHPKLSSIEATGKDGAPLVGPTVIEFVAPTTGDDDAGED